MATNIVTVCLPPVAPERVHDALVEVMAPYDQNMDSGVSGGEWQGEWDWWHVFGGDDERGLRVRSGFEDDPRIIRNPVYREGEKRLGTRSRCDGGPRGLLDFDTDRAAAEEKALATWQALSALAERSQAASPLRDFLDRFARDATYPVTQARQDYMEQPFIRAAFASGLMTSTVVQEADDPVARLELGWAEFLERERSRVIPTAALIGLDGKWRDDSCVGNIRERFARTLEYLRFADRYLLGLDADVLVVRIRFHS
ncbi:hypothetical protein AB0Q95_41845 [Streptomyces sp. NPDC059900]|uniref:hypothetical protein n=1 Tax=Streptomyces sp. NPDC059900 TaxID=3155816 RepID=UPI00341F944A